MTTIAYKDGVIAADHGRTIYQAYSGGFVKKIFEIRPGLVLAGCGRASYIDRAHRFCLRNKMYFGFNLAEMLGDYLENKDGEFPGVEIIIIGDGVCCEISDDKYPNEYSLADNPMIAIGSGWQLAMGAMANGASAIEAIKIAAKYDHQTFLNGEPDSLTVT